MGELAMEMDEKKRVSVPAEMDSRFFHCVWEEVLDDQGCRTPAFFKGFSAPGNQLNFTLVGSPGLLT